MPAAIGRITADPDRRALRGGLVLTIHCKTYVLQKRGNVVSDLPPLVLGADEKNEPHWLTAIVPSLVNQLGTKLLHLLGNDRFRLFRIVGVMEFQPPGHIGQAGVVGKSGGQRQVSRHSKPTVDFLGNIIPIDQPVYRLANRRDVKRIKLSGLGKGRPNRVECKFGTRTVGYLVLDNSRSLYSAVEFGIRDTQSIDIDLSGLKH